MATKDAAYYLLLEDVIGERLTRGERYKKIAVNKGALLRAASLSSENFSVSKAGKPRSNIKYKGTVVQIPGSGENSKVLLLTEVEYRLLKGVAGDSARYEVYTSGRLKVNSGEKVFVELANVSEPIAAVLRWRGVVHQGGIGSAVPGLHRFGDKELKFGIEIVDTKYFGYGDSDGGLNGVHYFHCECNHGSFVSWDKLFLPSNFDDASDTQSTGLEYNIARDVKWAISTETLSSCLSMDDNHNSLLIPEQRSECGNRSVNKPKHEIQHQVPEGRKEFGVTEINISTGFEREWWEISRKDVQISNDILRKDEWGCVVLGTLCRQKVAIKSYHQDIMVQLSSDQAQQEMRKMAQVRHPNLLLVLGAILDPVAGPLIVTEFLDQTLQSAYKDQLLEDHSKLPILQDIASALNYLHSQKPPIVHGNVNSRSVLLEALRNGRWKAKLSDFGIINMIHSISKTSKQGRGAQSDEYSAPELHSGMECHNQSTPLTVKIDVYSFGVILRKILLSNLLSSSQHDGIDPWIYQLTENCTGLLPHKRPAMDEVFMQIIDKIV